MKKKRKKLPGITLLELIIVMAIFSAVAVGALAMVSPAIRIYHKTAAQENAIACADNIARFIQDSLRYSDKMIIYKNTGISDWTREHTWNLLNYDEEVIGTVKGREPINAFIEAQFRYGCIKRELRCQREMGKDKEGNERHKGDYDKTAYVNPISYFVQYYYPESQWIQANEYDDVTVYVMEITPSGEVTVYGYPILEDPFSICAGSTAKFWNDGVEPIKSSVSPDMFGGVDGLTISPPEITNSASDGLKLQFNIEYKGATGEMLQLPYNVVVNYVNVSNKGMYEVRDDYPYRVKPYDYLDWGDPNASNPGESSLPAPANFMWSAYSKTEAYVCASSSNPKSKTTPEGSNTYIVYSIPEIVPTD